MRAIRLLLLLLALLSAHSARAQQEQEASVVLAAVAYLRSEMPNGPVIIDAEAFRGVPTVADRLAVATRGVRGRIREERQCDGSRQPGRPLFCSMRRHATVLAFSAPVIRGDFAQVIIGWWYQEAPGVVTHKNVELALARDVSGKWAVEKIISRGMT